MDETVEVGPLAKKELVDDLARMVEQSVKM
jgi:hypothetical protein